MPSEPAKLLTDFLLNISLSQCINQFNSRAPSQKATLPRICDILITAYDFWFTVDYDLTQFHMMSKL